MKSLILNISEKAGLNSSRTKNIAKHIGWSSFYKAGSLIANFMLVPLTLDYLDAKNYGVWLTISSFIGWFAFFDIGLGNGLRNKFAEAKTLGKNLDAQAYVSTAYYTIGSISLIILIIFLSLNNFINWTSVFNIKGANLSGELSILLPVIFTFFCLQLVAKLITSIYQANQQHSIQDRVQFMGQALALLTIWLITKTTSSSLLIFGVIFSALPLLILIILNFVAFNTTFKDFKPKLSLWKRKYLYSITGLGFRFFIIQIAAMILFTTDNFIISKLFGPEEVVPYNIAYKYFSILTIGFGLLVAPFWSSFTEAYTNKDFNWIKGSVHKVLRIWFAVPFVVALMLFLSDYFYSFWIGDAVRIPFQLSLVMGIFVTMVTYNMIFSQFINGVGLLKLSLVTATISMTLNIPLSILFGSYFNLGSTGVILATCVCMSYSLILKPLQYKLLINNKARGIWRQ